MIFIENFSQFNNFYILEFWFLNILPCRQVHLFIFSAVNQRIKRVIVDQKPKFRDAFYIRIVAQQVIECNRSNGFNLNVRKRIRTCFMRIEISVTGHNATVMFFNDATQSFASEIVLEIEESFHKSANQQVYVFDIIIGVFQ